MGSVQTLLFLGMVFTVEFYWYLGLRYWNGGFFLCAVYSRYILSKKKVYLVAALLAPFFFHVALFPVSGVILLNEIFKKRLKLKAILAVVSISARAFGNQILLYTTGIPIIRDFLDNDKYIRDDYANNAKALFYRSDEANWVYQSRWDILFGMALLLFYFLWRRNRHLFRLYPKLLSFLLLLYIVVNLFYVDIILYQRTYKLFLLMTYAYLFLLVSDEKNRWINRNHFIRIALGLVVFFALLTAIVEQRATLLDIELWFSCLLVPV